MKKAAFAIVLVALLAGGGYYWWSSGNGEGAGGAGDMPPPQVSVLTISPQQVALTQRLPGRISPFRQSQVRPQVDGIITARLFEEGQDVEKGQQLYQIDDTRYKAVLNGAIAALKSAETTVKTVDARAGRYKGLVKVDAVSKQEYDDVKADLEQARAEIAVAQAAVDVAQVNLDYTKVYAPISGHIGRSLVTEGTLVTANQGQVLAVITQLDPVYVDMQLSGDDALRLRSRMAGSEEISVHLALDKQAGKAESQDGVLKFSEVTVDESTGSIALRALASNPDGVLLPGLFVRTTLDLGRFEAIVVPQRAAIRSPDGSLMVWVVDEEGKAQPRPIKVEQAHGEDWIVSDGLKAGDKVIVEGYMKIGPGAPVSPVPWQTPEAASPGSTGGKKE